jgi:hypothetical protein
VGQNATKSMNSIQIHKMTSLELLNAMSGPKTNSLPIVPSLSWDAVAANYKIPAKAMAEALGKELLLTLF